MSIDRRAPALPSLLAAAVLGLAAPAAAGELGRIQYAASCAQCHGPDGRGDGPIAGTLRVTPPDLTGLTRANGGVFPFSRVYAVIETGGGVTAHGTSEMPAWGDRFAIDALLAEGVVVPPEEQPAFARARILALIDHLAGLQQED
jgi:mono/diheme cytochrome c family protein